MWTTLGLRAALSGLLLWALLGAVQLAPKPGAGPSREDALVVLHVRDADGLPLVARVRAQPRDLSRRVLPWKGQEPMRVAAEGEAALRLPAGRYRLFVTRGPTFTVARIDVELAPGGRLERTVHLAREVAMDGVLCADLHVHTAHSEDAQPHGGVDGLALAAEGLDGTIATDHNRVGRVDGDLPGLAGAEVTTWAPEVGHFNAFPLRVLPRWQGTSPTALLRELRTQPDVFVQINHPRLEDHIAYFALGDFDGSHFRRDGFDPEQAHGLEVWNGYDLPREARLHAVLSDWRKLNERGRLLTATGGSDSHGRRGHFAGYPRTCVRAGDISELPGALRRGQAFVTSGPLLALRVQGKEPGERALVGPDGKLDVAVEVRAGSYAHVERLEVWAGERLVAQRKLASTEGSPQRLTQKLRVDPGGARTLQVLVRGRGQLGVFLGRDDAPALAFTNVVRLARRRQKRPASAKNAP